MANFEAFRWNFSSSTSTEIGRSDHPFMRRTSLMSQMSSSLQRSLSDQLRRHKALQMTPITLCHHGWTLNSSLLSYSTFCFDISTALLPCSNFKNHQKWLAAARIWKFMRVAKNWQYIMLYFFGSKNKNGYRGFSNREEICPKICACYLKLRCLKLY